MFFTLANSRSYIARPAAITADTVRTATPAGSARGSFENALEDTTARLWEPDGLDVDAQWDAGAGNRITLSGIGMARASLGGATLTLRHRTVPTESWNTAQTARMPDGPVHTGFIFPEISARLWQLLITDVPVGASVGWLWLGEWLRFPRGPQPPFTPPSLSTTYEVSSHLARSAQALGSRSQLTAGRTRLVMSELPIPWLLGQWEPVREHLAQSNPLLFIPDTAVGTVGLVQADGQVAPVQQSVRTQGSINIRLRYLP